MNMTFDKQFTQIAEALMEGKFICKVSDSVSYEYLEKDAYRQGVDEFFRRIGRQIARTEDGTVYFLVYMSISSDSTQKAIRGLFDELANSIQPLVAILRQIATASQSESTLQAGDSVRFAELLSVIERTPALHEDLSNLVRAGLFATQRSTIKDQFAHVLTKLVALGYLVPTSAASSNYIATGKWSFLYECLDFMAVHERIKSPDEDQQMGLI